MYIHTYICTPSLPPAAIVGDRSASDATRLTSPLARPPGHGHGHACMHGASMACERAARLSDRRARAGGSINGEGGKAGGENVDAMRCHGMIGKELPGRGVRGECLMVCCGRALEWKRV